MTWAYFRPGWVLLLIIISVVRIGVFVVIEGFGVVIVLGCCWFCMNFGLVQFIYGRWWALCCCVWSRSAWIATLIRYNYPAPIQISAHPYYQFISSLISIFTHSLHSLSTLISTTTYHSRLLTFTPLYHNPFHPHHQQYNTNDSYS